MDGKMKANCNLLNLNSMKCEECDSILSDGDFIKAISLNESFVDWNSIHHPSNSPVLDPCSYSSQSRLKDEGDVYEESDFSGSALKYINQMLMEEDIEDKNYMFQESAALQAAEMSFYNVLMVKESPCTVSFNGSESTDSAAESVIPNSGGNKRTDGTSPSCDVSYSISLPNNYSSLSSTSSSIVDGFVDSPVSILSSPIQFRKDIYEANRVFSNGNMILDYMSNDEKAVVKLEKKHESSSVSDKSRGKKNIHFEDHVENERSSKQSAVYTEPSVRSKVFDDLLLYGAAETHPFQGEYKGAANVQQKGQLKGSNGVKTRGKEKKEVVDLRTLLTLCAQSVSINDQRGVTDLLKRIREHASPTGDGMQRLAHYFSAGLEARMAGSGTGIYKALVSRPTSAVNFLKAYQLFLSNFPFIKLTYLVSNKTIMQAAHNKRKLHIIDFGILYGFQWPCLIERLSTRPGGPPELRITGIDFPCPGFRPSQRVEETGCRLTNYAETFGVPFKFKAIAKKWETITLEDLDLDDDETLVVNCGYRFRNLLDESVMVDSPRNKVLNLIRKTNPKIFIQGVVNGSYNAPFFVTRFREALFFFSSVFDMLDATVDREIEDRMLVEKTIYGREAMNVIACEGGERIERPETYKQWQVRNQRAGFCPVPLDPEILKMAYGKARTGYHKDLMIDEDGHWLLQGWKGRIIYAISCWKPDN
ncbi:scarecrow-like protein 9 [Rutidosis leptorrhynchoides]|uniref:scarecrow-like protein 9 n=1 Tax=Rutidosis leptorrhynchoides TaxID=125765 RepID=UPI003A9961BB